MKETLLIGIGAQKAGTTWLADYLRSCQPCVHLPPAKEVHYFDTVCMPKYGAFFEEQRLAGFKARVQNLTLGTIADVNNNEDLQAAMARFIAAGSREEYIKYLNWGRENEHILCDITPDYALLDQPGFELMQNTHANIKLVFILRNPADRFWSSLRFNNTHNPAFNIEGNFDKMIQRDDFLRFANYERTIQIVLDIFGTRQVHVDFYENLFCDEAIKRLCLWLGVDFARGDYGERSNAAIQSPMPAIRRKQAVLAYRQTYEDMARRYGDKLPRSWRDDIKNYLHSPL